MPDYYDLAKYPFERTLPVDAGSGSGIPPYFQKPGVALVAFPRTAWLTSLDSFFAGWDPTLSFDGYVEDDNGELQAADRLCKFAGQLCYLSFGPNRTKNSEADKYFANIKQSLHGSVLEHANFSLLFWGVSRSFTHELVRHRAGFAFSQVSQRYVSGKTLRFVERPEYQKDPGMHAQFLTSIRQAAQDYDTRAACLLTNMAAQLDHLAPTERRKAVNQAARSCLPNETEAPILVTANARAWRHFLEMRCARPAEPEARIAAYGAFTQLERCSKHLFSDYTVQWDDFGYPFVETATRKV